MNILVEMVLISLIGVVKNILLATGSNFGQVEQADACSNLLPKDSTNIWFTDPPYYNAIPYADLSDFFFVWLKRALPNHPLLRDPFDPMNPLAPKAHEICEMKTLGSRARYPLQRPSIFEEGMKSFYGRSVFVISEYGVSSVVFAHKTAEGWEALLSGMIRGGWMATIFLGLSQQSALGVPFAGLGRPRH